MTNPQQPTTTNIATGTATDDSSGASASEPQQRVEQIDPATLLVDVNVRTETVADKEFIASIRDLGVLQPIRAVRTAEGEVRVEFGHRRTLAAIEAGLGTVPVIVVADEQTDTAGQVERIVRQYAENEHRTGLTHTDKLGVVEQLSLLKVSAAQIAKRTKMKRPHVDQALAITRSKLAKAASERYELTLDQAAAVAEFDSNPDTVTALIAAVKTGQFDHVLARARQDRDDAVHQAEVEQQLTEAGVRVIQTPTWGDTPKRLSALAPDANGNEYTVQTHAECAGHVAWAGTEWVQVDADGTVYTNDTIEAMDEAEYERFEAVKTRQERRWVAVYGCDDPDRHHTQPSLSLVSGTTGSGTGSAAGAVEAGPSRRVVIENNKAWDAATGVRRAWLREFFQRKTAPAGAAAFTAHAVLNRDYALRKSLEQGHALAVDLFGVDGASASDTENGPTPYPAYRRSQDLATLTTGASDKRLTLITLGVIMAAYENALDRHSWRESDGCTEKHYLLYLDQLGYQLSAVERLAAGLEATGEADSDLADSGS